MCQTFKSTTEQLPTRVEQTLNELKSTEKQLQQVKSKLALSASDSLLNQFEEINGVKVLITDIPEMETKLLRELADKLRDQAKGIVLLMSISDGKASIVTGVHASLTDKVKAGEFVNIAANIMGGKGGGRPDSATAGGTDITKVQDALDTAKSWLITNILNK